ncbi:MAG: hypothetical protein ABEJ66_02320 [Candidatus Nanohaloarchaea archaeon]
MEKEYTGKGCFWTAGGCEDEEQLELKEEKHGKQRYVSSGAYSIELGEEESCLEAFDPA